MIDDVLETNELFYAAFAERDLDRMESLWCVEQTPTCVHPGWPPIRGRAEVLESLRAIFAGGGLAPTCEAPTLQSVGDVGIVLCRERLGAAVLVATNVFVREGGAWRLLHHHASAVAQVPETPPLDPELMPN